MKGEQLNKRGGDGGTDNMPPATEPLISPTIIKGSADCKARGCVITLVVKMLGFEGMILNGGTGEKVSGDPCQSIQGSLTCLPYASPLQI